ncbi:MAG: Mini-ribonuclease 3 [Mogibacterium sp.]|nr:Mini-ribonuclease 3 [Mogibacterium sp.]
MAIRSDLNTTALAYLGDAVYEVIIRGMILEKFPQDAGKAHKHAVKYVSAEGQARAARQLIAEGFLTEEEEALLKRARNHRSMSRPQHADPRDYKYATGFEALLGYLHLAGKQGRIREITDRAIQITDTAGQ